ncbi:MAG: TIGR03000 domain-containing protein [Pirellulaceae bacterium]
MIRKISFKLVVCTLSLAVVATGAGEAFAGWRWHGSSGGSSGGGSSGGWSGGSNGGGYAGWGSGGGGSSGGGSSGGWGGGSSGGGSTGGQGWWKRHMAHKWSRWQGGSSGGGSSGGWSGGSSGGGSSGGWGSSGGQNGGYYYAPIEGDSKYLDPSTAPMGPMDMTPAQPLPEGALPEATRETSLRRADGLLEVRVPDDAKIFVNGLATSSSGAQRQYVSRGLTSGLNYNYEVRAEVVRDGKTVEQVKSVSLRAGQTAEVAFDFPAARAETSLTIHVPAEAKVYLAGNETNAQGETRVFRTTGLSGGKAWNDYTVRVEFEQDGRVVSQEKTIDLSAGESQELTFDFAAEKVASR